jgi:VWFA-related protein
MMAWTSTSTPSIEVKKRKLRMHVSVQLHRILALCCAAFASCAFSAAQQANDPQAAPYSLEVNVNRVLVPVVVRDKQGHTVSGLKQEDFQVLDNGKPHPISSFQIEQRGVPATSAPGGPEATQQAPASAAPPAPALPKRIVVFLFDDIHMGVEDLAHAQQAGVQALPGALAGSDMVAVVSVSGKTNSGITNDHATLRQAIMSLRPQPIYRTDAMACPIIDYYQADLILNKRDPMALQDAMRKVLTCNPGLDAQRDMAVAQTQAESAARRTLSVGEQEIMTTYANIAEFVRRMAKLPGQHTMILISSGFQPVEQQARTAESRLMDLAAASNVTISALDARGLYTTEWTASERSPALSGPSLQQNSDYKQTTMKLAEDSMGELADGTGGAFFHNRNDLDAGLKELAEAPETLYILELSLGNEKPDGTYHRLKVTVDRSDVEVQARRGYFVPRPEKNKK